MQEEHRINGDPAALNVDRAIGEIRRGRAVRVADGDLSLVLAAVETTPPALLRRLEHAANGRLVALLTAERALAVGLVRHLNGPVSLALPPRVELDALRGLAGVGTFAAHGLAALDGHAAAQFAPLTAAALQIAKAARLVPALVGYESGAVATAGVLTIDVADVAHHSRFGHRAPKLISRARVPLADAVDCEIALFRDEYGSAEHVAVLIGKPDERAIVPVRLHSACLTGDLLGSLRCDCGEQLRTAVARIATLGGGVLLYLDQEGRGIGLPNKLRAYVLQDGGLDTVDADRHLGFLADERSYDVAAALLTDLGITRIRLLTNNPQKIAALRDHGIEVVGRLPLVATRNSHNERYLRAKLERAGHLAEDGVI